MKKLISAIFGIVMLLSVSGAYTFKLDDEKAQIIVEVKAGKTVLVKIDEGKNML